VSPPRVNCPTCQRELDWQIAPFRPFCSERCRLIDLGAWLAERHAIAGDAVAGQEGADASPPPAED
jgi:endogenous inhibitor of DNA gyrase (YacG/DUF329 family)